MDEEIKKHILKTGTTTVGIICKEGVVVAADKRGSYGGDGGVSYIASRDHTKVHEITEKIIVTGAGVVSDIQRVVKLTRAELKLKELRTKQQPTVKDSANLFSNIVYQNIRQFSPIMALTHFLLAGYDNNGFYLFDISPDGTLEQVKDYEATGSGMLQAHPILDSEYNPNMSLEEGLKLAKKCINASRKRDPASGDGIDIFTVTKEEIKQAIKQELVSEFKDKN
jgi:proteasome beta subunit